MTKYEDIYEVFFDKAKEYELDELPQDIADDILFGYLKGAINQFSNVCTKFDLYDRDEDEKQFNEDLGSLEIDILAECMVLKCLKAKKNNSDLFKNGLSTKDYTLFSPANLLSTINNVYNDCFKEVRSMLHEYSFNQNDVREFKVNEKR